MKKYVTLMFLLLSVLGLKAGVQTSNIIQDPLLDYYKYLKSPDYMTTDGYDLKPNDLIHCFTADISGNGKKSFFITDSGANLGPHGGYAWEIYYPSGTGVYTKINDSYDFDFGANGPNYIGYINQIKRYGLIRLGRSVTAYYYHNYKLIGEDISSDPDSFIKDNPNYNLLGQATNIVITTYTLTQLAQMYGNTP